MSTTQIPAEEYAARRLQAVEAAKDRGLSGLLIWSLGGPSCDWYGDVFYLANYHGAFNHIHDTPSWTGRGHSALILPVDDDPTLVVDTPHYLEEHVHVSDIRFTKHVPQTTAQVLEEKGLSKGSVGLVGRETLLLSAHHTMEQALGRGLAFEPADDILTRLRMIKSEAEIKKLKHAANVGVRCMRRMMETVEPGTTDAAIIAEGFRFLAANGGRVIDIPLTSGPQSHRYWMPLGPPHWDSKRKLEAGESVNVDLWGLVDGYYVDFARSTVVGGRPSSAEQEEVLEASIGAVEAMLSGVKPGVPVSELYELASNWLAENGISIDGSDEEWGLQVLAPLFGHGLGLGIEKPWVIENEPTRLERNMVFSLEAMVARVGMGSNFEREVVVTANGYELLDGECQVRWWN